MSNMSLLTLPIAAQDHASFQGPIEPEPRVLVICRRLALNDAQVGNWRPDEQAFHASPKAYRLEKSGLDVNFQ